MAKTEGNEPAYPIILPEGVGINTYSDPGFTKREVMVKDFAAAIASTLHSNESMKKNTADAIAKEALLLADSVIEALNAVKQQ